MNYSLNSQGNFQQNYPDSVSFADQVQETKKENQKQHSAFKKEPNYNRHRKFVIKLVCTLDKAIANQRTTIQVKNDEEKKKKAADAYYILNKIKTSYNPVKKANKRGNSSKVAGRSSSSNMYQLYCNKIFRTNLLWPFLDRIHKQSLKCCQPQSGNTSEQQEILASKEYWSYYVQFRNEERQNGRPILFSKSKRQKLQEIVEQKQEISTSYQNETLQYSNIFINNLLNFMLAAEIINENFFHPINSAQPSQNTCIKSQFEEESTQFNQQSQTKFQMSENKQATPMKKVPVFIIQEINTFK